MAKLVMGTKSRSASGPANAFTRAERRDKVRIGIVGCGAITEGAHLPAVLSSPEVELTALADTNEARLRLLQRQFELGPILYSQNHDLLGKVDAVVLALPNALHAKVGIEFLSHGVHVLCEKPLAVAGNECEALCRTAQTTSTVLAVGYVTRFFPSTELTKQLIDSSFLGALHSFDYEFGTQGGWATTSGYNLARSTSGGGVLAISGSHFLDRMLYLLGDVELVRYVDDSRGGVEANCVATFRATLHGRSIPGQITLSKTHKLLNRFRLVGEKGALEVAEGHSRSVNFFPAEGGLRHEIFPCGATEGKEADDFFRMQLDDFVQAIRTGTRPRVNGEEGARSALLIELCYAHANPLEEPWCDATIECLKAALPRQESTNSNVHALAGVGKTA